jgi:pimeloyl-ACP methyl ester carboxylesterase
MKALVAAGTQGFEAPNFPETEYSPACLAEHRAEALEHFERLAAGPSTPPEVSVAQMRAVFAHDTYDRLPSITAPTLVINGAEDPMNPPENARILGSRIPEAELILVEGARHDYRVEVERAVEANIAVLDFLRRNSW